MDINKINLDENLQKYILKYILYQNAIDIDESCIELEYQNHLTFASFKYNNEAYNYYMFDKGVYYIILDKLIDDPKRGYIYTRKVYNAAFSKNQLWNNLLSFSDKFPFDLKIIDTIVIPVTTPIIHYCYLTHWIDKNNKITIKETRTCPQVPTSLNSMEYGEYEHAKLYSIDKYSRICVSIELIPILISKTDTNINKIDCDNRFKNYDYYLKLHKKAFKSKLKKAK